MKHSSARNPQRGEEAVLGDVVVDDGIDLRLAGIGDDLDGSERFDGQALSFLEAGGGQFVGFFRAAGRERTDGEARALGVDFGTLRRGIS